MAKKELLCTNSYVTCVCKDRGILFCSLQYALASKKGANDMMVHQSKPTIRKVTDNGYE